MHKKILSLCLGLALILFAVPAAMALNVDVYSGHSTSDGGTPYSGLVGSFTSPKIRFGTNTGYDWHPFGLDDFGADITGFLNVAATGTYKFTLKSDDGSLLYIDGGLVVDNGGIDGHPPVTVSNSTFLTAGIHPFEVQFYEDFGGRSGVDLHLPIGVNYSAVPLPPTVLLLGSGLLGLAGWRRFRKG